MLGSRRLHAGHHASRQQASLAVCPGPRNPSPVLMTSDSFSTRRQRFTHVRLPSTHLTGTSRLFQNAHDPGHWTGAASGGLDPDPAVRARGACPHLSCSMAASVTVLTSRPPLRLRGARCGSEPCERRVARDRRETGSAGPSPAQVTDLRLLYPLPGAAVSRVVERFAEQHVSRCPSRKGRDDSMTRPPN